MVKVILCEGSTDAVLISYYLITVNGWNARNNRDNKFDLPFAIPNDTSQNVYWYNKGDDTLAIWAVGGMNRFAPALTDVLIINAGEPKDRIDKIVVISDRDHAESEEELLADLKNVFASRNIVAPLENNAWTDVIQVADYQEEIQINVACLVVPFDRVGAIETFMLDSLSEQRDEELVIQHARKAVSELNSEKYLLRPRDRLKAELGTSLALMFPEKVFSLIDELIRSIKWEDYKKIRSEFSLLDEL